MIRLTSFLWLWFQCVCPLATPTILLGFLLPWAWGISLRLLQQSAAIAPYLGWRVSPHHAPCDLECGLGPLVPPVFLIQSPTPPPKGSVWEELSHFWGEGRQPWGATPSLMSDVAAERSSPCLRPRVAARRSDPMSKVTIHWVTNCQTLL